MTVSIWKDPKRREAIEWMREHTSDLAQAITDAQFKRMPELEKRYGAVGREKCVQDNSYHLHYLTDAVISDSSALFVDYVAWAKALLRALNIPGADLKENLVEMRELVSDRAPADLSGFVTDVLDEAVSSFGDLPDDVETFLAPDRPLAGLARRYLDSLLGGDRRTASRLIMEAVEDDVSIRDLYMHVFQACQHEIGRLWQLNKISVAQEHYCTAATQLIMSQLYSHIFAEDGGGRVLVAGCVTEDLHELGVRMVSDFFEMEGWDTYYLGANVPIGSLLEALKEQQADVLALSVTIATHIHKLVAMIEAVRSDPETAKVRIIVGGLPFTTDPELWRKVGADGSAATAADAIELALQLSEH